MNGEKFDNAVKNSPKVYAALKAFIIQNLLKMQKEMIGDHVDVMMPDINTFITDDMVLSLLRSNVRILYDFFDNQKLYVNPKVSPPNNELRWYFTINGADIDSPVYFNNRLEAEVEGFTEAFTILEKKL